MPSYSSRHQTQGPTIGAAEHARKACNATVHVHAPELARAHGQAKGSSPFTLVPGVLRHPLATLRYRLRPACCGAGFMFPTWVNEVTPFDAGHVLDLPGRPRPISTPGHTEGHVCFLLEQHGVVITGDAIATLNVLTRQRGPQLMPDQLNGDPRRTRSSLDVLAGIHAGTLLPGHGDPFLGDPADAVNLAKPRDH